MSKTPHTFGFFLLLGFQLVWKVLLKDGDVINCQRKVILWCYSVFKFHIFLCSVLAMLTCYCSVQPIKWNLSSSWIFYYSNVFHHSSISTCMISQQKNFHWNWITFYSGLREIYQDGRPNQPLGAIRGLCSKSEWLKDALLDTLKKERERERGRERSFSLIQLINSTVSLEILSLKFQTLWILVKLSPVQ